MRERISRFRSYFHGTTLGQTLLWLSMPLPPVDSGRGLPAEQPFMRREAR